MGVNYFLTATARSDIVFYNWYKTKNQIVYYKKRLMSNRTIHVLIVYGSFSGSTKEIVDRFSDESNIAVIG